MKRYLQLVCFAMLTGSWISHSARAEVGNDNPTGVTGEHNGSITTAGSYDPYTGNAKRFIDDLTVTGAVGAYPLKWTRVLNSRGAGDVFGHGGGWSHSYNWGLWIRDRSQDDKYHPNPYEGPAGMINYPDGRAVALESPNDHVYTPISPTMEPMDRLEHAGNGEYNLLLRDGGRVEFRHAPGAATEYAPLFAKTIVDPFGLGTSLDYDSLNRLFKITEPAGRYLQINYERKYGQTSDSYIDVISSVEAYAAPGVFTEKVVYDYEFKEAQGIVNVRFWYLQTASYDDQTHAEYAYYDAGEATNSRWSMVPGRVKSCHDVRFGGPMKNIQYEYLPRDQNHFDAAWGQVLAEDNATTGERVSWVDYPTCGSSYCVDPGWRIEHRPDGATRRFDYYNVELSSYTDFSYQGETPHSSTIQYAPAPGGQSYYKTLTDARSKATRITKDNITGAVLSIKHPGDGSTIDNTYSDPNNAYYVTNKSDERAAPAGDPQHTIFYDRIYEAGQNQYRIWRVRYPDTSFEEFTYNGFGEVLTHRLTSGGTETFVYDENLPLRGLKTSSYPPATESDPAPWTIPRDIITIQTAQTPTGCGRSSIHSEIRPGMNTTSADRLPKPPTRTAPSPKAFITTTAPWRGRPTKTILTPGWLDTRQNEPVTVTMNTSGSPA